jgi:hypothetical protein
MHAHVFDNIARALAELRVFRRERESSLMSRAPESKCG